MPTQFLCILDRIVLLNEIRFFLRIGVFGLLFNGTETGLTHPILWMSGKSKNVEAASRVYFPLPGLSRKIETLLAGYKTSGAQFAIKALSF